MSTEFERTKSLCVKRGDLWEDPEFPAVQSSVFYHQTPPFEFVWKRPKVRPLSLFIAFLNLLEFWLRRPQDYYNQTAPISQ